MYFENASGLYYTELQKAFIDSDKFNLINRSAMKTIKCDYLFFGPGYASDSGLSENENKQITNIDIPKCLFLNKEYKNLQRKFNFINKNKIDYVFTVHHNYELWNRECPESKFYKIPFAYNHETFKDYNEEKDIDVGFTGNLFNKGVYKDTDIMGPNFNNVRERIFNTLQEDVRFEKYNLFLGGGMYLQGEQYGRAINRSKVWICTPSAIDLVGTRFYEIMGSKSLLFCKHIPNIYNGLFEEQKHYVSFEDDLSNFSDKLIYYLKNNAEREAITSCAYSHVREKHKWENRVDKIYSILNGDKHE
jgi:spore maturation protein CgeB